MVLLQRKLYFNFQGFRGDPTFSRGRSTFFSGGGGVVQMLISIETHMTCDFPGESGPPPSLPSGAAHENKYQ